ncbi:MAG: hypothetical protein OXG87_22630 [Gemmatimonadetes bacterium]|nr:hypothetical protein [Gemmatimonadota bacterium]
MKKLTVTFVIVTILLNAIAPTLAHAATYLQGTEVNANTLVQDAYVAVTYYDSNGKQKLEKGWIDAIGETSFTIRSGGIKDKKTISYDKVVSVFISEETNTLKQMNEVNQFIGEKKRKEKKEEELKAITIMSGGQIDLSKIRKGWYAHVIYTSKGEKKIVTGRITRQDSVHIVIRVREERALKISKTRALTISKTIAYKDIDTLVISQYMQEAWKNAKYQVQRHLKNEYYTEVRVQAPSIWKGRVVGRFIRMRPDTLVIQRGGKFFEVPHSAISNFEVNIRQRNTGKGMAIGFGVGAAIFWAVYASLDLDYPDSTEGLALLYVLGYISIPICALSTLIGATIKTDKWVKVSPYSLNLSLAPTSSKGLRAALTFNF